VLAERFCLSNEDDEEKAEFVSETSILDRQFNSVQIKSGHPK
jgi:hypothetical protein